MSGLSEFDAGELTDAIMADDRLGGDVSVFCAVEAIIARHATAALAAKADEIEAENSLTVTMAARMGVPFGPENRARHAGMSQAARIIRGES